MGKIAFLRPVLRKSREFSRCFRTNKNSLRQPPYRKNYQQNHTPESVAEFLRGGAILRSNGSVVEKCDVIEIVEITPTRQTVIIQDPARHERIQRTHLENRRALQRQRFVARITLRDIGSRSKRSKKTLVELRRLHDYAQIVEIKTTTALEPLFPGLLRKSGNAENESLYRAARRFLSTCRRDSDAPPRTHRDIRTVPPANNSVNPPHSR